MIGNFLGQNSLKAVLIFGIVLLKVCMYDAFSLISVDLEIIENFFNAKNFLIYCTMFLYIAKTKML